jgi:hypothetical protein
MNPMTKIAELEAKRDALEQMLVAPERVPGEWLAIRRNLDTIGNEITARITSSTAQRAHPALTFNHWREARGVFEMQVACMTVHGKCNVTRAGFSGCCINGDGTVLTTKHQFVDLDGVVVPQTYTLRVLVAGEAVAVPYTLSQAYSVEDIALLVPVQRMSGIAHFEHRKVPLMSDYVFAAARVDETYAFMVSEGTFNYTNARQAFVTAHADNGWSGGPVFHFHDGHPVLVALVHGPYGQSNLATSVKMLPRSLLTDDANYDLRPYARRTYGGPTSTTPPTSAASISTDASSSTDTSTRTEASPAKDRSTRESGQVRSREE